MAKSERVLVVVGSLAAGGTERVVAILASDWAARGHSVCVLTYSGDSPDHYWVRGSVERRRISLLWNSVGLAVKIKDLFRRWLLLRNAVVSYRPDVIISFGEMTNVRVLLSTFGSGLPVVASERIDPRQFPIPRIWRLLRRLSYPLAAALVVQTDSVATWAQRVVPRNRVAVIPNPLPAASTPQSRPSLLGNRKTVLAAGRLDRQKGFDLLLQAYAMAGLPTDQWQLVILGEGPERAALELQSTELRLSDAVVMPGVVADPSCWMQHSDLFVLSSRFEGFPNVLIEAMNAGLAAIAFDCASGPSEILSHDRNGVLVAPGDIASLASAIRRLASDAGLRKRLAESAQTDVKLRCDLTRISATWESTWRAALDRSTGTRRTTPNKQI